jgi:hypothetical protein
LLHCAWTLPAQICSFVGKSGFPRYCLMLLFVTATGVSKTAGTSFVPLLIESGTDGCCPFASAMASLEAASASFLIAL